MSKLTQSNVDYVLGRIRELKRLDGDHFVDLAQEFVARFDEGLTPATACSTHERWSWWLNQCGMWRVERMRVIDRDKPKYSNSRGKRFPSMKHGAD